MQSDSEQFDPNDVQLATRRLAVLRFWPADEIARAEIGRRLVRMVPSKAALDWLVDTMIDRVGEWRGIVELRGVLCARYRPADGIEAECIDTPGFTPADGEARFYALEASRQEQKRLAPESAAMARRLTGGEGV